METTPPVAEEVRFIGLPSGARKRRRHRRGELQFDSIRESIIGRSGRRNRWRVCQDPKNQCTKERGDGDEAASSSHASGVPCTVIFQVVGKTAILWQVQSGQSTN